MVSQVCQPSFASATCVPEPNPCSQTFKRSWTLTYDPTFRQTCKPTSTTTCWFRSEVIPYRPTGFPYLLYLQWFMTFLPPPFPEPLSSAATAMLDLVLVGSSVAGILACPDLNTLYYRLIHRGPLNCMGCNYFWSGAATTYFNIACNLFPAYSGYAEFDVCPLLN